MSPTVFKLTARLITFTWIAGITQCTYGQILYYNILWFLLFYKSNQLYCHAFPIYLLTMCISIYMLYSCFRCCCCCCCGWCRFVSLFRLARWLDRINSDITDYCNQLNGWNRSYTWRTLHFSFPFPFHTEKCMCSL